MTSSTRLRDARPAELAAIRDLTIDAYRQYESLMDPAAWAGLRNAIERTFEPDAAPAARIVAEADGTLLGSVMLYPPGADPYGGALGPHPRPEVSLLAVAPDARGRGIGLALMEECTRRAAAQGALVIGIHTSRRMKVAIEMYRRMGFRRAPDFDFRAEGAELVEAFTLDLQHTRQQAAARPDSSPGSASVDLGDAWVVTDR
jgi:ribosomal protein S18 acetylase RimI-like enzyme